MSTLGDVSFAVNICYSNKPSLAAHSLPDQVEADGADVLQVVVVRLPVFAGP